MRALEDIAQASLRCGRITCQAAPSFPCVTTSGAVATRPHAVRTRALLEAWRVGFHEGGTIVLDTIESECDPDRADLDPRATLTRALGRARSWLS